MKLVMMMVAGVAVVAGVWGLSAWAGVGKTGGCCGGMTGTACPVRTATTTTAPSSQPTTQVAQYVCPMDSDVVSDKPGKCTKCGMALVKK